MISKKLKVIINCSLCMVIIIWGIYSGLMRTRYDSQYLASNSTWEKKYSIIGKEIEISIIFDRWVNSSELFLNNCSINDSGNSSVFIPICPMHYAELNLTMELILNGNAEIFTITNLSSGIGSLTKEIQGTTYYLYQISVTRYTPNEFRYNSIEITYNIGKYDVTCHTLLIV